MRPASLLTLLLIGSAVFAADAARADEVFHLTPPLYREQARATQQVRRAGELTTTPQPLAPATAAPAAVKVVAEAAAAR
ncbi:hypothetical protein [Methylobacterium sp. A54F]